MGRLRYIGSKARISTNILDVIGSPTSGRFVDVFSGTGAVSREALLRGWKVWANDYLASSAIITAAQLFSTGDVRFAKLGGYLKAIDKLNSAAGIDGFVFREYSPSGCGSSSYLRKYFTVQNAKQIDGIRQLITTWRVRSIITDKEEKLLVADLIEAANRVANISGTYGCFLKNWTAAALKPIILNARDLHKTKNSSKITAVDAFLLKTKPDDLIYLDPPYTKRQYASYYHLLETIALADSPIVSGVTGLRPWKDKSSLFCFKRHALSALIRLIKQTGARKIALSYSSEGHIDIQTLQTQLEILGKTVVHKLAVVGRYRPNVKAAASGQEVVEYLIVCEILKSSGECKTNKHRKREAYCR